MALALHIHDGDSYIYIWKMEETEEELYGMLGSAAESMREECMKKYNSSARRLEWLTVRALLLRVTGGCHKVSYRSNGEPFLLDSTRKISISHTRGYVAVALDDRHFIGVDIEFFSHRVNRIVDRFMTPQEHSKEPLDMERQTWYSLIVWSIKESVYKCLDINTLDYLKGISVAPFSLHADHTAVRYSLYNYPYSFLAHYRRTEDYVLTWCRE